VRTIWIVVLALIATLTTISGRAADEFLSISGDQFTYKGNVVKLKGTAYYPKGYYWKNMWNSWPWPQMQREIPLIADLGCNIVRILVPYDAQNVDNLDNLDMLIRLIGEWGMKVDLTLFDWRTVYPDPDTEPADYNAEIAYLDRFVEHFKNNKTIAFWSLKNEPDVCPSYPCSWESDINTRNRIMNWYLRMRNRIRTKDTTHPVFMGIWIAQHLDDTFVDRVTDPANPTTRTVCEVMDVAAFHSYTNNLLSEINFAKSLCAGKPVFVEEYGWPSHPSPYQWPDGHWQYDFTEADQNSRITNGLTAIQNTAIAGGSVWIAVDNMAYTYTSNTDFNNFYGLYRYDYTLKPAGITYKNTMANIQMFDYDGAPSETGPGLILATVTDAATGQPLAGAVVTTTGGGYSSTSSDNGSCAVEVMSGRYDVSASKPGWQTLTLANKPVTKNGTTNLSFALAANPNTWHIIEGPRVKSCGRDSVVIYFRTIESCNGRVDYGLAPNNYTWTVSDTAATEHSFTLTGLMAGTTYYYRVVASGPGRSDYAVERSFRIPTDATAFAQGSWDDPNLFGDMSPWVNCGATPLSLSVEHGPGWGGMIAASRGHYFLALESFGEAKNACAYQRVSVIPGNSYTITADVRTYQASGTNICRNRIGVDTTGGTDPTSANVTWSALTSSTNGWTTLTLTGIASATGIITIFLDAQQSAPTAHNINCFDAVTISISRVTGLTITPGPFRNTLTWTNPNEPHLKGVRIVRKLGSNPADYNDGTVVMDRPAIPGAVDSFVDTGLPSVGNIGWYYGVYTYAEGPVYSTRRAGNAMPTWYVGGVMYEDTNPLITYSGNWIFANDSQATNGSFYYTYTKDDTVTFHFTGPWLELHTIGYKNRGISEIRVDGKLIDMFDGYYYLSTQAVVYGYVMGYSGFSDGPHTLTCRVTGTKNYAASFPYYVLVIDAFRAPGAFAGYTTLSAAKEAPDGTIVALENQIVSAVFDNAFYIENGDRTAGIKVVSATSVNVGQRVNVIGPISTVEGERQINATGITPL